MWLSININYRDQSLPDFLYFSFDTPSPIDSIKLTHNCGPLNYYHGHREYSKETETPPWLSQSSLEPQRELCNIPGGH